MKFHRKILLEDRFIIVDLEQLNSSLLPSQKSSHNRSQSSADADCQPWTWPLNSVRLNCVGQLNCGRLKNKIHVWPGSRSSHLLCSRVKGSFLSFFSEVPWAQWEVHWALAAADSCFFQVSETFAFILAFIVSCPVVSLFSLWKIPLDRIWSFLMNFHVFYLLSYFPFLLKIGSTIWGISLILFSSTSA